ncbi:MAG: ABC transporter substrate-binding protein [Chloroflexi bacterium]|nr:ABC transporter substrate-binding protein [Chloroflexota bacterium]
MIYIGLDDTDNKTSRGTGNLARAVAASLSVSYQVRGVTRHQLLVDPRVPYTSHNSCNVVHLLADGNVDLVALADQVEAVMLADFQPGSDPGLCVARTLTSEMIAFGHRAKTELLRQAEAREIAERNGCVLRGLGGTQDGVIGALAGVGLAATGEDGRFVLVGRSRELAGVQSVQAILEHGIAAVRTSEGAALQTGLVETGGKLRPALRGNQAVLVVKPQEDNPSVWLPLKLD